MLGRALFKYGDVVATWRYRIFCRTLLPDELAEGPAVKFCWRIGLFADMGTKVVAWGIRP